MSSPPPMSTPSSQLIHLRRFLPTGRLRFRVGVNMGAPLSPPRKTSVSEHRVHQGSRYTCGDPPATSPAPASKPAVLAPCRVTTHPAPPTLKVWSPARGPPGQNQTVDPDVSSSRGSGKSPPATCSGCQQNSLAAGAGPALGCAPRPPSPARSPTPALLPATEDPLVSGPRPELLLSVFRFADFLLSHN